MNVSAPVLDSICRALSVVEENLQEETAVADLADAACYSLYHFCRLFGSVTHYTPYEYLMRRRLSEAAQALVETRKKIIEIAFEYQFNRPETFGRAFKRMFGILPNQWRARGKIVPHTLMPAFRRDYLEHLHKGDYLQAVLEEGGTRYFVGVVSALDPDSAVIPRLWTLFEHELRQTALAELDGDCYGIRYYPNDWEEQGAFYMAAKEIAFPECGNPALLVRTLPPLQYARFIHNGTPAERRLTMEYIYHTWLPKSGRRISFPLEIECYGECGTLSQTPPAEYQISLPLLNS